MVNPDTAPMPEEMTEEAKLEQARRDYESLLFHSI